MKNPGEWFTLSAARKCDDDCPPNTVSVSGVEAETEEEFANVLTSLILSMRASESNWGNGPCFGGASDLAEMAAHFFLAMAEHESKPGGYYHFDSDEEAAHLGVTDDLRKFRALVAAARDFVPSPFAEDDDPSSPPLGSPSPG